MADKPLIVTADDDLLDDLLRLAAVAGTQVHVAADWGAARPLWRSAPVVLLGTDVAQRIARPVRRGGVVLVGNDLDDARVWELGVHVGADHVAILPDAEPWLTDMLATSSDRRDDPAPVFAVIGGRGGAGATTLAVALAAAGLRAGLQTLLVDADPLGGGIDLALGGEGEAGLRWDALSGARGRLPSAAVTAALPRINGLTVLTWDRAQIPAPIPVEAIDAALDAGRRGHDLVIADVPRQLDAGVRGIVKEAAIVFLVVPAELRAAAAAAQVAAQLRGCSDVRLVVRGPAPGGLHGWLLADALKLPLAAFLRPEPGLAAAYERGESPGTRGKSPLAVFASGVVTEMLGGRAVA